MNQLTKITVITVAFNSERTIERTIQSVVSQNYENLEYWIIDGASTDRTVEIVRNYAQKYSFIRYISEPDEGISDAFNKGISKATGELIGLINSDDQLMDGALSAIHTRYCKTSADILYGDTIVDDVENRLRLYKKAGLPELLKYEMPFIHQSCFVRRTVYEECGGYSSKYKICMDYDMFARIYHKGYKFADVGSVISIFQYGGTSCKHPIKTINENMRIASKYGLTKAEVFKYKFRVISRNVMKLVLSKMGIWSFLYKRIKKDSVIGNVNKEL